MKTRILGVRKRPSCYDWKTIGKSRQSNYKAFNLTMNNTFGMVDGEQCGILLRVFYNYKLPVILYFILSYQYTTR